MEIKTIKEKNVMYGNFGLNYEVSDNISADVVVEEDLTHMNLTEELDGVVLILLHTESLQVDILKMRLLLL